MLADGLVILSLALSVIAAGLLAVDAVWAQGARFQRDNAESKIKNIQDLIEAEKTSVENLPQQYTEDEKKDMIVKFEKKWEPRLEEVQADLKYWKEHPARVQQYAMMGLAFIAIASILQGIAHFLEP